MVDSNGMLKMALPQIRDDGDANYLVDMFARMSVKKSVTVLRQDNCLYEYGDNSGGFMGFHASESDGAHYLLDRVVGGAIIDLARLVDVVCERGDDPSLVSYIPLEINETKRDLVFAAPIQWKDMQFKSGDVRMQEDDVVLTSHFGAASRYLKAKGLCPQIKRFEGSLGTAARALYGPCSIVGTTKTGESLSVNGLYMPKEENPIIQSEAVLAWFEPLLLNPRAALHISNVTAQLGLRQEDRRDMSLLPLFSPGVS